MKASEVRTLPDEQLAALTDQLREEWRDLRFKYTVGQLQNTKRIWQIKRDIARIMTIQTEREMEEQIASTIGTSSSRA
ncbi:50S ribosomal protein L29 [soil metagenome]|jgi:large subunit ribosomal protein L29